MINLIHNCSMNNVVLLLGIFIAAFGLTQTSSGLTLGMSSVNMIQTCSDSFNPNADYSSLTPEMQFCLAVRDLHLTESDVDKLGPELNWLNYTLQTSKELVANFDLFKKYGIRETLLIDPLVGTRDSFPPAMRAQISFDYVVDNKKMTFDRPVFIGIHEAHICQKEAKDYRCEPDPLWKNVFTQVFNNTQDFESGTKYKAHEQQPPLKQFEMGIKADKIICNNDLVLILKASNDSPACVKPVTKEILIERGWAKPV